jgi:hypothetical protein
MNTGILKMSVDWAKAEVFSGKIVGLVGVLVLLAALGFFQLGKTAMAKALVWPVGVAGLFLMMVAAGLIFANQPRPAQFEAAFRDNPAAFVQQERLRTATSQKQLGLVFKILPGICIVGALLIWALPGSSTGRAIGIVLIGTAAILMGVDANTEARNDRYHAALVGVEG